FEDGLPDHREPEVAGFDQPGVDRPHRDLVHPGTLHGQERERLLLPELRRQAHVAPHRVHAARPVVVPDQPAGQRVVTWDDPVQVMHLPLEASRREGEGGEARYHRVGRVDRQVQLHPPVRAGGGVEVDGAERVAVVVRRDQRQPVPLVGQPAREIGEGLAGHGQRGPAVTDRRTGQLVRWYGQGRTRGRGHDPPAMDAAAVSRSVSGQVVTPSRATTTSPTTSGTAAERGRSGRAWLAARRDSPGPGEDAPAGTGAVAAPAGTGGVAAPPAAACPEAVAPTPTGSRATGAGAVGSVVADSVMAGAGAPSSMPAVRAPMAANPTSTRANASATTQPSCSAASARARPTSLAKSAPGGRPSSARVATPNTPPSTGARLSRPRTPAIRVVPSRCRMWPLPRQATVLARPWPAMCSRTAAIASRPPTATPSAIRPMCSMLE